MIRQAAKRGYSLTHRARQTRPRDFDENDLILIMDEQNRRDIRPFAPTADAMRRVRFLADFASNPKTTHVPDPYYGDIADFEEVLDIVENTCRGLLAHLQAGLK
jgi:protein-tyrosine phosphatase